ncbi:hypothetical protein ACHAXN_006796 [Cyclotella atomus]
MRSLISTSPHQTIPSFISPMAFPAAAAESTSTIHRMLSRNQNENGLVHVSTPLLLATAVPLLMMAGIGHRIDPSLADSLGIGVIRSFVQLMMLGVILNPIFKWGMTKPWVVGLYVFFMMIIATNEAISRPKYTFAYHPLMTFCTILISMSCVGLFAFGAVIRPSPLWNPQYVIPLCGMLLGNTINGIGLSVNNMATQVMEGGRREIELCLSFGATGLESVRRLMKDAIGVGVTPMVNQLNVIGLVSIPGMMTGQILGGSPVTEAARYQVLIIWLIGTINFSSVFMNTYMVYKVAFDTGKHMLRTERIIEVVRRKRKGLRFKRVMETVRSACRLMMSCCRNGQTPVPQEGYADVEQQPLSSLEDYGTGKMCNLEIQTRNQGPEMARVPLLQLSQLQYSVPKSHSKQNSSLKPISSFSSLPDMAETEQQRILCRGLDVTLHRGEIGIVRGKSGSGKSTLLRVISGLAPMDEGNITADGLSLSNCEMTRWRSMVRYVTQYKVDIPGSKYAEFSSVLHCFYYLMSSLSLSFSSTRFHPSIQQV